MLGAGQARVAGTSRSTGLHARRMAAIERGRAAPSDDELVAIADACGVDATSLVPPQTSAHFEELGSGPAMDALLREYLAMVIELRNAPLTAMTLRDTDLSELAKALGGTPAAIEARLRELLGADEFVASDLRETLLLATGSRFLTNPAGHDALQRGAETEL